MEIRNFGLERLETYDQLAKGTVRRSRALYRQRQPWVLNSLIRGFTAPNFQKIFSGKACRTARRVHANAVLERVILRFLTKAYILRIGKVAKYIKIHHQLTSMCLKEKGLEFSDRTTNSSSFGMRVRDVQWVHLTLLIAVDHFFNHYVFFQIRLPNPNTGYFVHIVGDLSEEVRPRICF